MKFTQIIDNQETELFVDNEDMDGSVSIQLRTKMVGRNKYIDNAVMLLNPEQVQQLRGYLNSVGI